MKRQKETHLSIKVNNFEVDINYPERFRHREKNKYTSYNFRINNNWPSNL